MSGVATPPATNRRRLSGLGIYTYDGGNSDSMTKQGHVPEASLLVDPTNVGVYGLAAAAYKQFDFTEFITQFIGQQTPWYIIITCEFTFQDGTTKEYFAYPIPDTPPIGYVGGAETHQLQINTASGGAGIAAGGCTSICVYSNVTSGVYTCQLPVSGQ